MVARISKILYTHAVKPIVWLGSARADVRRFPAEARRVAGFQLWKVQSGLTPDDWRAMVSVGAGVREIRVRTGVEHRILYVARFAEGIYVLHAFEKKTQTTSKRDLAVARRRFSALAEQRASK